MFANNPILPADYYKGGHFALLPDDTQSMWHYLESRGGPTASMMAFGAQAYAMEYLNPLVTHAHVDEALDYFGGAGAPFNEQGWRDIVTKHGGVMPLTFRAAKEGTMVPVHNVMAATFNAAPGFDWLPGYMETSRQRALWYPGAVATISYTAKKAIYRALMQSSEDPDSAIKFALHDFGGRGVSSGESAGLGGAGHLVNFYGTDTVEANVAARRYYDERIAGFTIPAGEHLTVISWGKDREVEAYRRAIQVYGKPGAKFSMPTDSYDHENAVRNIIGKTLKAELLATGATFVVRPDSGIPNEIVVATLRWLDEAFGSAVNKKGYKVLHPAVRVIQGDGIDLEMISLILKDVLAAGFSVENVVFGMGGALLQKVNRDTYKVADKASSRQDMQGNWIDFNKAPKTDLGKTSKKGRLALVHDQGKLATVALAGNEWRDELQTIWSFGEMPNRTRFPDIRARAHKAMLDDIAEEDRLMALAA